MAVHDQAASNGQEPDHELTGGEPSTDDGAVAVDEPMIADESAPTEGADCEPADDGERLDSADTASDCDVDPRSDDTTATDETTDIDETAADDPATHDDLTDAEREFVEAMIARGEAVVLEDGEELPAGATHEIVTEDDGPPAVKRRRFSLY